MSVDIKELEGRILAFLYWEGQIDPNYFTVDKIQDETELICDDVQDGLELLRKYRLVECNYREREIGIKEAKITNVGIKKAVSLINI